MIRLLEGRVRLTIQDRPDACPTVLMRRPGGRRFSSRVNTALRSRATVVTSQSSRDPQANEVETVVLRGAADLMNEDGQTTLRAGERAFARAGDSAVLRVRLQLGRLGCFRPVVGGSASGTERGFRPVLPETVQYYSSTFDRYGSWRHDASYGVRGIRR